MPYSPDLRPAHTQTCAQHTHTLKRKQAFAAIATPFMPNYIMNFNLMCEYVHVIRNFIEK